MNKQTEPVDVLDVLDRAARELWVTGEPVNPVAVDLISARAAIAKLFEEASRAERLLRDMAEAGFGDPSQADALRTALALVGGAK